ncbi:unnamed protein product [Adineta steineri]|uniref:Uncharacterized protein n=1 Tax=Adineta steineri TaxID=433720 RepID=A0A814KZR1_9BILA|nr:unnamed protein product [Adineta steineri]CAF1126703.1 unnamed protein product [Adineta steineri]
MFALKLKSTENAKAIRSLTLSNMFICAREGDFIVDQLNFFNSNLKDNNEIQGCASALFDGQRITQSISFGRTIIENKSLCICVGPIGSKWANLLMYLDGNKASDGFHPRFIFHCLETIFTVKAFSFTYLKPILVNGQPRYC